MTTPTQPPYHPHAAQTMPTNGMAIASLVCAFVFAPAAIVLGVIARQQIRETNERGDGLALAGIIIGTVECLISVIAIISLVSITSGVR